MFRKQQREEKKERLGSEEMLGREPGAKSEESGLVLVGCIVNYNTWV